MTMRSLKYFLCLKYFVCLAAITCAVILCTGCSSGTSTTTTTTTTVTVAAPTPSVAAGTYTSVQTVTLTSSVQGAQIYYTLDGSTPTAASTLYTQPLVVTVSETIKSIALVSGQPASSVTTTAYIIILPPAAAPTFSIPGGTYTSPVSLTLATSIAGAQIYYTTDGSTPTVASALYSGTINVAASETVNAIAIAFGFISSPVSTATYTINYPAPTPAFSVAGGTYTSAQTVALTTLLAGAQIYYTLDGSNPTSASMHYGGPITVSTSETIKAITTATGYSNSAVAAAAYVINLPTTPTVTLSVSPTSFTLASPSTVAVHVSCNAACGVVNLTIDGNAWQTGTLDASGNFSTSTFPSISAGGHVLQANYPGNGSTFNSAQSSQVSITITSAPTTTPAVTLSTHLLQFLAYGTTQDVTLTNSGTGPLTITGVSTYSTNFTVISHCGSTVAAGSSCLLSVTSSAPGPAIGTPLSGGGPSQDQLVVTSNDPAGTNGVALTSIPVNNLGPTVGYPMQSSIVFPDASVGASSTQTLDFYSGCGVSITGAEFTKSASTQASYPGYGCEYVLTFTPTVSGSHTGKLVVGSDGEYVPLSGNLSPAPNPNLVIAPATTTIRDFVSQQVTISNYALTALNIQSIAVDWPFTQTNNCGTSIPASSVCTITVSSAQLLAPQGFGGLLTIMDDAGTQHVVVTGIVDAILQFGATTVGATGLKYQLPSGILVATDSDVNDFLSNGYFDGDFETYFNFTPTATGPLSSIVTTATQPIVSLYLLGTGVPAPSASVSVNVLPLGVPQVVPSGATGSMAFQTIATTSAALTQSITGANASDFTASTNGCDSLPVNTCRAVKFSPSGVGTRTANLIWTGSGGSYSAPITAIGTPPAPQVTIPPISTPYNTPVTTNITVVPSGGHAVSAYLSYDGYDLSNFALTKSTCAQGESPCKLQLLFNANVMSLSPITAYVKLVVVDNATGSPITSTVSANIQLPPVTLSPTSYSFGNRSINTTSLPTTITVSAGGDTFSSSVPTITGPNASEFSMTTTCPTAGTSCTISVSFAPKTSTGPKSATVTVNYGNNQTATTTLSGVAQ